MEHGMNDQDYIRKAVELADGWADNNWREIQGIPDGAGFVAPITEGYFPNNETFLDALAAQLVRQVDALNRYDVRISKRCTLMYDDPAMAAQWGSSDDNRTMNTIKVIVDSEVLK